MSNLSENAIAQFDAGHNCSQAVVAAACEKLAFDKEAALNLAKSFGGGRHEVCGALAGGILALGLKYSTAANTGSAQNDVVYSKARELVDRFQKRHGGINCKDLLGGCDLQTAEGKSIFKERGLKQVTCACCVASVASILEEIL
ncbi:MAG: C-GCAxxG-C-C family protein [Nibricoccus sp.]